MINSWHSKADPSRQCCCAIAGVRTCPAPGWCPEGSWQMVLTLGCVHPHILSTTKPYSLGENTKKEGTCR